MKKYVNEQQGFGFFLTFLILVLGMVIGITLLMTVLNNSKAASKTLGNAQAKDLAVKGVEAAAYSLNEDILKNFNGKTGGLSHKEYIQILEREFNQRLCNARPKKPYEIKGETGTSTVCINEKPEIYQYNDIDYKSATYKVTFKSTGFSNSGEKETTYKTMLIGSEGFPEALRFALSTYNFNNTKRNGNGNLYLHGSTDIQGDIKVDQDLIVSSFGSYLMGQRYWIETGLPMISPIGNNDFSKITVGGNLYRYEPTPLRYNYTGNEVYLNHISQISQSYFNSRDYIETKNIEDLFKTKKKGQVLRVTREGTRNAIDIGQQIKINQILPSTLKEYNNLHLNQIQTCRDGRSSYKCYTSQPKTYSFNRDESRVFVEGQLYIGHPNNAPKAQLTVQGNPKTGIGVTFYVDGDVIINNVNLTSNMLIYTTGKVTIRESTIKGVNLSSSPDAEIRKLASGTLIIFAKQNIDIANNSLYSHTPSRIKGFFLTEENIEMYGAGSNIELNGGISANRIVLNTLSARFPNENKADNDYTSYVSSNNEPRLKVHYDPYLIESYLKLYPPEPVFYGPDVPIEYEIAS